MTTLFTEQCAKSAEGAPPDYSKGCLFVATSLATWTTAKPEQFARDFQINDTVYRRLDPEYYAWLRSRMVMAKNAAVAGQIDAAAFEELRLRFNSVHDWAVGHFGEEALQGAVRGVHAFYSPPVPEDDHPRGRPPQVRRPDHVSAEAISLVDSISQKALALGWTREQLYGPGKGLFDTRRGVVCYLGSGDRISEVTAQSIEIVHARPTEVHLRFYNPDVEQPWIGRVE